MFKLNRMDKIHIEQTGFEMREVPAPDLSKSKLYPKNIEVTALVAADMKWRLVEEYGPHCYKELSDGKLLFHGFYTDMEGLISWILTFGDKIEILEPVKVREELLNMVNRIKKVYER